MTVNLLDDGYDIDISDGVAATLEHEGKIFHCPDCSHPDIPTFHAAADYLDGFDDDDRAMEELVAEIALREAA
jgi:hypothetical protein